MFKKSPSSLGQNPATFKIAFGFQLIFISSYSMQTYRTNLRGHLRLDKLQPCQCVGSLSQCSGVLRDPMKFCPSDSADEAMSLMDRLADML